MANLNVLALGDSIMWGQGNTDAKKFVGLVCAWLGAKGNQVNFKSFAHSGAIAARSHGDGTPAVWGEVPRAAPSVQAQIQTACQSGDPDAVDILLLNGGINDISAFGIVVSDPFDPAALEHLAGRCTQVFTGPVQQAVAMALASFKNAHVVLTAYYPIISQQTGVRNLARLMRHLPRPTNLPIVLDWAAEHMADAALEVAIAVERRRMVEQSALFATRSIDLLRAMAADCPDPSRVSIADPGFGPENAYAAPKTWLWNGGDDPLASKRATEYAAHVIKDPLDWPVYTPLASLCHPNEAGSAAYAKVVEECLSRAGW